MIEPDIVSRLRAALEAQPDLEWAYLFGSAARGEPYRDLDVALMPRGGAFRSLLDLGRIAADLEAAAGGKVDVLDATAAALPVLGHVLRDRVALLDRAPRARWAWEADVMRRWLDFQPVWERAQAIRREALRQRLAKAGG